jgi:transcriptional regulator with XRE-family HTH domain
MGDRDDRAADMGRMLRQWREARDPELVPGLVPTMGSRRRQLTQMDMALLLGVSERWYRALEAGERRKYSRAMIDGIIRILDLVPEAAAILLNFTGYEVSPWRALRDTPHPYLLELVESQKNVMSYLCDEAWYVITCNKAAAYHDPWLTRPGANIMKWAVSPDARFQVTDWERSWATPMLSELRTVWQRWPDNERIGEVVAEVREAPGVAELWERTAHVQRPYLHTRYMYFPLIQADPVAIRLLALGVYGDAAVRWILISPEDPTINFAAPGQD